MDHFDVQALADGAQLVNHRPIGLREMSYDRNAVHLIFSLKVWKFSEINEK